MRLTLASLILFFATNIFAEQMSVQDVSFCIFERYQGEQAYKNCMLRPLPTPLGTNTLFSGVELEAQQVISNKCQQNNPVQSPAFYECLKQEVVLAKSQEAEKDEWPAWNPVMVHTVGGSSQDLSPSDLYEKVSPSIYIVYAARNKEEMKPGAKVSLGSAVAVSHSHLLTNCHVLEGKYYILIKQGDKFAEAELVASDPSYDKCIIEARSASLIPVPGIRPFNELKVGERVYSIGTPSGLEKTLAEGLISGLRTYEKVKLIQTSAAISKGSSGGGLFDAKGNLIGITTMLLLSGQSLNFAIAASEFVN